MNIMRKFAVISTGLLFVYTSHQLFRYADMNPAVKVASVALLGLAFLTVAVTFFYLSREKNLHHQRRRDLMMNISLTVMAYLNFLVTLVLIRDLVALTSYLLSPGPPPDLYGANAAAFIIAAATAFLVFGHLIVRIGPRLVQVPIFFSHLPGPLEGLRILHITDLHISPSLPADFVRKLVEQAHRTEPDLIVFTGDILDSFVEKHSPEMGYLKDLRAKYGVYLVTGNHEYYWSAAKAIESFQAAGIRVLTNEVVDIPVGDAILQLAGIPDPAALHFQQEGPEFKKIQTQLSADAFKLILSHQPKLAIHSSKIGFDLQLSGHTHGGQFFPWNLLIRLLQRYSKGLYTVRTMRLYVNQGTGYWGPRLRLGTYCELAEIVLRKG